MKNLKKYVVPSLIAAALFTTAGVSAEASGKEFKDVSNSADYYHTVKKLVNFKIIGGYSDGTFKPGNYVTRGQAASMVARILNVDLKNVKDPGFKDVSTAYTHYPAIAKLTEMGIFDAAEKFDPNRNLTRAEMADILVNAFNLVSDEIKTFDDVDQAAAYYKEIGIIGALDITRNEGKFRPEDGVKRANFAVFIERVINFKRADDKEDLWDSWGNWDSKGVIKHTKPTNPENDDDNDDDEDKNNDSKPDKEKEEKIEKLEKAIDDAIDELEDAEKEIDDIMDDLKAAEEEEEEDDIEEEKDNLSDALKEMDRFIEEAEDVLKDVQKADYEELDKAEDKLENAIRKANKTVSEANANSFDEDYHEEKLDDALDELEDAIKDANKALKDNSLSGLKKDYEALVSSFEDAEKTLESYQDSNVESLEDEEEDLEQAIKEAEDLIEKIEDTLEDKLDDQIDYFKDRFKDIIKELDEAIDDKDKGDIYDAQEELEEVIENAEKVLKDYKNFNISTLSDEIESLEKLIKDAEKELKDSK
nr:S-layer homology domain-containing protein [Lysinibacillus timonensis]